MATIAPICKCWCGFLQTIHDKRRSSKANARKILRSHFYILCFSGCLCDCCTARVLQVMRRFASIRGWPSKELRNALKDIEETGLKRFGVMHGMDWNFTPVDAPWMNGVTEAWIKPVKNTLNAAIGDQIIRFNELKVVMFEAAQIVNQRPTGRHTTSPDDGSYLCPNDLFLGRSSANVLHGPFYERANQKFCFDNVQQVVEHFWKKRTRDYFPGLIF